MCEWAGLNPGRTPERSDVEGWIVRANSLRVPNPGITIASTPDSLPHGLAMALVGGGYHEAWHTKYSCHRLLHIREVWPKVLDLWRLIPSKGSEGGWAPLTGMLLIWNNIIEDIRIERLGCRDYPGAPSKMEALQDLILKQEDESRAKRPDLISAMSVVVCVFRDLGLGYDTPTQRTAFMEYKKRDQKGYDFVTSGPLKPFLERAINLSSKDDLGSMWLSMELVAEITKAAKETPSEVSKKEQPQQDQNESQPSPPYNSKKKGGKTPPVFKVKTRAVLKSGPYKGRRVEIVRAGLPNQETGEQALEYVLL